jgi:hypothetical protein
MIFSLDYDGTYNKDPELWNLFIKEAIKKGHEVVCITMRCDDMPSEKIENMPCKVFYTNRMLKLLYTMKHKIHIDVWIDDMPSCIC